MSFDMLLGNWIFLGWSIISIGLAVVVFVAVEIEEGSYQAFAAAFVSLCLMIGVGLVVVTSTGWGM